MQNTTEFEGFSGLTKAEMADIAVPVEHQSGFNYMFRVASENMDPDHVVDLRRSLKGGVVSDNVQWLNRESADNLRGLRAMTILQTMLKSPQNLWPVSGGEAARNFLVAEIKSLLGCSPMLLEHGYSNIAEEFSDDAQSLSRLKASFSEFRGK